MLEQVTARSKGVLGYVKLLGLLVERNPNLLLEKASAVQDVFGYVSVLPPAVAERFLLAVAPLLRLRPRLQDAVVLPLRKALFSREERARLVAVEGLVLLLKVQSRNNAAAAAAADQFGRGGGGDGGGSHGGTQMSQTSQMSEGQQVMLPPPPIGGHAGGGGRALSLAEGFGLLRRCLTQQMVVRAKLYDGLLSSFAQGWVCFCYKCCVFFCRLFRGNVCSCRGSGWRAFGHDCTRIVLVRSGTNQFLKTWRSPF